jgi:tetratricopeptide (TPR) repeat protein
MVEIISPGGLKQEAEQAYKNQKYLSAAKSFEAAADGYMRNNEQLEAAQMLNNASVAYLQADYPESALEIALNTDEFFAEIGGKKSQAIALGNQAAAYEALSRWAAAPKSYQASSDLLKEIGDKELRPTVMQSLSAVQLRLGRKMEALVTMQAGMDEINNPSIKQKLIKKILRSPFSYLNRLS